MSKLQPIVYWSKGYGDDEDYIHLAQNTYKEIYAFTVPNSGVYKIHSNLTINSGSDGRRTVVDIILYRNSTELVRSSETVFTMFGFDDFCNSLVHVDNFLAGDNVRIVCHTADQSWPKVDKTKSPIFIHHYPTGVIT